MPAEVWLGEGNDDEMAGPGRDLLVAAGAEVGLAGLVRLDPPDLYLGISAHRRSTATTANAATTST